MTDDSNESLKCKIIASFVALSSHLVMHQIDVTSAHIAVAFNIPLNNISIYFSKLFSFRCLLIAVGSAAEFTINLICSSVCKEESKKWRKYLSMGCFGIVLILRLILLMLLYFSKNLGFCAYIILSIEAFFFGYFHCSVLGIAPEYSVPIVFSANASRLLVLLIQFILDICLSRNSLKMIQIQTWISSSLTTISVGLWVYCYYKEISNESSSTGGQSEGGKDGFFVTLFSAFSPFMMFFAGSMFKDFLFPGVLPYALLHRDKCHLINMLVPVANMLGPTSIFILESINKFDKWSHEFDSFWVLVFPMLGIFIYSVLAIHTRKGYATVLIESKGMVLIITIILVLCNSFMDPLSFGGVAKKVQEKSKSGENKQGGSGTGSNSVITFHLILALFMRFVFSKLAVGYNDTRISLGYYLPLFRPTHKMSKSNLGWYLFNQAFVRGLKDTGNDFKMNIRKYL